MKEIVCPKCSKQGEKNVWPTARIFDLHPLYHQDWECVCGCRFIVRFEMTITEIISYEDYRERQLLKPGQRKLQPQAGAK